LQNIQQMWGKCGENIYICSRVKFNLKVYESNLYH
jgi:hypothetical protein